ncbi:MAG: hypothetical protein ABL916_08295 [Burkholderiaceae bacterium]
MFALTLKRFLHATPEPTVWVHSRVCPPKPRHPLRAGQWREWLTGIPDTRFPGDSPAAAAPARSDTRLTNVRNEFIDTLDDIPGHAADDAIAQIYAAASMHDLWHLRLDVFNLVSCHHDQAEADQRLSQLNRHFPTRSPRSGFGALGNR